MIEPNQGHPMEGYRGDTDTPRAHLHKCNFPSSPHSRWPSTSFRDPRAMILMASSQQRFSHSLNKSATACSSEKYKTSIQTSEQKCRNCEGQAENHMHSKLFCLAAAKNHMLAYHTETLYHSLNIDTALIVNWIISIWHQAEMKYCKVKHSCEVCTDPLQSSMQENPEDCPLHMHVPWFVIQVDPPPPPHPNFGSFGILFLLPHTAEAWSNV